MSNPAVETTTLFQNQNVQQPKEYELRIKSNSNMLELPKGKKSSYLEKVIVSTQNFEFSTESKKNEAYSPVDESTEDLGLISR